MMFLNQAIRKLVLTCGYQVHRSAEQLVNFNNFSSLVQTYEQHLNELGNPIAANETRTELLDRLVGTPPSEAYLL